MKSTEKVRIGLTVSDITLPFFVVLNKAAEEKAAELGVELVSAHPASYSATEQIAIIEDFVRQKVDAIIVAAVDSQSIVPAIEKANHAGISVIAVDVEIWGGKIACSVQTDNIRGGEMAGEYIAERLGYKGKVINIHVSRTDQADIHRLEGLHNVLDRYPDIEVVFEREAGWAMEDGWRTTAEALSAYPDANAIFTVNDPMLRGALNAVKEAGKLGRIVIVGFDVLPEVLVLIDRGEIDAGVQQFPDRMGAIGVEMAFKAACGEEIPPEVKIGVELITRENVHEAAMDNLEALAGLTNDLIRTRLKAEAMNAQLLALHQLAVKINTRLEPGILLEEIVQGAMNLLKADTGVILLLDEKREVLTIKASCGLSEKVVKGTRDRVGESIAGRVVQTGQPIIAHDLPNDPRFYNPSAQDEGLLACISTPIVVGGEIIGTLDVHSKKDRYAFTQDHLQILSLLASQAATALENARLLEQVQRQSQEIIEAQRKALRELSTPIVPVSEEIIAMPLIGVIDTTRAQQVMEALLMAISRHQAEVVIIDITGVPVVDTGVANHILQTTRAANLLGSRVVLTGIAPEVAQTIVSLGVDLSGIVTRSNLQSGIEYALGLTHKRIVAL